MPKNTEILGLKMEVSRGATAWFTLKAIVFAEVCNLRRNLTTLCGILGLPGIAKDEVY